jgi:putative flippase GtrA
MPSNIKLGFLSIIAGGITSLIAIGISALLDKVMKSTISNFIGVLIAMCFNFIWQHFIFVGKMKSISTLFLIKYLLADVIILGSAQLLFILTQKYKDTIIDKFPDEYKEYYNSIMRLIISSVIWVIFSFPLRRYWVFI